MNHKKLLSISFAITISASMPALLSAANGNSPNRPAPNGQASTPSISGTVSNGDGTVTFNGREVWTGTISEGLRTLADVSVENGEKREYAAAWDGDELLWENVAGAGERLDPDRDAGPFDDRSRGDRGDRLRERIRELARRGSSSGGSSSGGSSGGSSGTDVSDAMELIERMMNGSQSPGLNGGSNDNAIEGRAINGRGSVRYNGKEVWKGRINGKLTAAAESLHADAGGDAGRFAAAWDDGKLIWENYPGAGDRLKKAFPDRDLGADPKILKEALRRKR